MPEIVIMFLHYAAVHAYNVLQHCVSYIQ